MFENYFNLQLQMVYMQALEALAQQQDAQLTQANKADFGQYSSDYQVPENGLKFQDLIMQASQQ